MGQFEVVSLEFGGECWLVIEKVSNYLSVRILNVLINADRADDGLPICHDAGRRQCKEFLGKLLI